MVRGLLCCVTTSMLALTKIRVLRCRLSLTIAYLLMAPIPKLPGDTEQDAAESLLRAGAIITRDDQTVGRPVIELSFWDHRVTDTEVMGLLSLKQLRKIDLRHTYVSVDTIAKLVELTGSRSFCLRNAMQMSDEEMRIVGKLKQLRVLDLDGTGLTDSGLKELRGLGELPSALFCWYNSFG